MMTASELRKKTDRNKHKIFGKSINDIYDEQNRDIMKSAERGRNYCIFIPSGTVWDVWTTEIKNYYTERGYYFEPIGYCGGVWQDGEYIKW